MLGQFLGYLARDISSHPERLQAMDAGFVQRIQSLVGSVEVDLNTVLPAGVQANPRPFVIHGWTVFAHPLFLAQIEALARQVETLEQKDQVGYVNKSASKRLATITNTGSARSSSATTCPAT